MNESSMFEANNHEAAAPEVMEQGMEAGAQNIVNPGETEATMRKIVNPEETRAAMMHLVRQDIEGMNKGLEAKANEDKELMDAKNDILTLEGEIAMVQKRLGEHPEQGMIARWTARRMYKGQAAADKVELGNLEGQLTALTAKRQDLETKIAARKEKIQ